MIFVLRGPGTEEFVPEFFLLPLSRDRNDFHKKVWSLKKGFVALFVRKLPWSGFWHWEPKVLKKSTKTWTALEKWEFYAMAQNYKLHDLNLPYIWQQKSQMINAHLDALAPAHLQLSIFRWLLQDMEGRYRNTSLVKWDSAAPRVILEGASIGAVVTSCWNRKTKSYSINSTSISVCLDNHSIAYFKG